MLAINSSVAESTGKTPHQLLYRVNVALPVDHALASNRPNIAAEDAAARAVEWSALATRAIARASQQQAAYVNRRRQPVAYQPDDLVLLSSRHLPLPGTRKLQHRWMGPFRVLKTVGPVACKLELPDRWRGVHPVFHVSLLRRWRGRMPELPPPLLIDGAPEFEIDHIVSHQHTRRGLRYTIRWKNYGPEEDTALYLEDLEHARDIVEEYHESRGLEQP